MTKIKPQKLFLIILGLLIIGIVLVLIIVLLPAKKPVVQDLKTQYLQALEKDESACEEIEDEYYHNLCLYTFTLKEAVEKKDPSVCETLKPDFREGCQNNYYFQLAQKEKDLNLCSEIKYDNLKAQCEEQVKRLKELETEMAETEETTPCDDLEGEEIKSICLSLFNLPGAETGEIPTKSQCQALKNLAAQEICLSVIRNQDSITIPIEDTYPIICNDIENQEAKDLCFAFFKQLIQ